jgi:hypothetical protein
MPPFNALANGRARKLAELEFRKRRHLYSKFVWRKN